MNIKKAFILIMVLCFSISLAGVSATEDINNTVTSDEISLDTIISEDVLESSNNVNKTFVELSKEIENAKPGDIIKLENDYYCNDSNVTDDVSVFDNVTIDGQGHKFDGNNSNLLKLFTVYGDNVILQNVIFTNWDLEDNNDLIDWTGNRGLIKNCTFYKNDIDVNYIVDWTGLNGTMEDCVVENNTSILGSVIYWIGEYGTIINSNFYNNSAENGGSILFKGKYTKISGSTFINNSAETGGAIYCDGHSSLIEDCIFKDNSADNGGAIYAESNEILIVSCEFVNNSASENGGAFYLEGYGGSVLESNFENNNATDYGGAIYCSGDVLNVSNSKFKNNSALAGGAILIESEGYIIGSIFTLNNAEFGGAIVAEDLAVLGSVFDKNNASSTAGAIYAESSLGSSNSNYTNNSAVTAGAIYCDDININYSNFIQNSADEGGALRSEDGEIIDSSFIQNTAKLNGGAIYSAGDLDINSTTFKGNSAPSGKNIIVTEGNVTVDNKTVSDTPLIAIKLSLTPTVLNNLYGYNFNLIVNLSSVNKTFNEGEVSITINNKKYTANVANNVANFSIAGLNAGNYTHAVLSYSYGQYTSTQYFDFDIEKGTAAITAKSIGLVITYGGKYTVTLKDDKGKAISSKKVTFVLKGKTIGSAKTNSKGVATFKITAKMLKTAKAGKRNLVINFTDKNYDPVAKTVKVTINKEKSKFVAKNKKFKKSQKTKKYTVALKNSKGKAIKKAKLSIKVKGKTYTAKTNSKGKAVFKITKLTKKGTFKATIKFKATKYYKAATKKVKITVR